MTRTRMLVLITLAALAGPVTTPAAAATPKHSACQEMRAKHRDLAPHWKVVIAHRGVPEQGNISGCVLPRSKVRKLATWNDGLARDWSEVVLSRGFFALIGNYHSDQYGGTSRSLTRYDVRSGRAASLAGHACMMEYGMAHCPDGTSFGKVVLGPTGAGAIERTDLATEVSSLESFDVAGAFARLDDAPVDTLEIMSGEIVWTRGGAESRVPLPG